MCDIPWRSYSGPLGAGESMHRRKAIQPTLFAVLVLCLCSCSRDSSPTGPLPPQVLRVQPDGLGDVPTIQAAIDSLEDGGVIELDDGTFAGDGNRDLDFGGKALTICSRSGDPDFCTIDCAADTLDPHRGFRFHSGEGPGSVLEAVTITRGCMDFGGAIYCDSSSSPSIVGCVFRLNVAAVSGGAVLCFRGASPSFVECVFDSNRAELFGGAVYTPYASPSFRDCMFEGGHARLGAGFATYGNCYSRISGCRFTHHWAQFGGAVYCRDAGMIIEHCTFRENGSRWCGAGIYCYWDAYPLIDHCTFIRNASICGASISSDGGSHIQVIHCTLYANSGKRGAGVECDVWGTAIIQDTIIAGSTWGMAVHCRDEGSRIYLQRCDLYGNDGGDWVGCAESQLGHDGNVSVDPMFCDPAQGVFTLRPESPCASGVDGDDAMGAWGLGCE